MARDYFDDEATTIGKLNAQGASIGSQNNVKAFINDTGEIAGYIKNEAGVNIYNVSLSRFVIEESGAGEDIISYEDATQGVDVSLAIGNTYYANNMNDGIPTGEPKDIFDNIEHVIGSSFDDTIEGSQETNELYGGEGDDELYAFMSGDILDGGAGDDYLQGSGEGTLMYGGAGNDTLVGNGADDFLDGGEGNDELAISGNAVGATLKGGAGEDTLQGGNGSIVYGDEGADTFIIGQQYLIADASGEDRLKSSSGWTLTGGVRWAGSESPWAYGIDGTKYAINTAGELVVQGTVGKETYVADFNNSLDGPYTAGIGIGELSLEFYRLLETPNGWGLFDTFEALMGYALKFLTGESYFGTVDPLVLDLDGDGIELMARSSVSPFFDVDGDGFAEQMGWVQGDDGFLVRDLNGNGTIDDIGEMFGDGDTSGFAALSEAKQYNGDLWNAEGISIRKRQKIARCGTIAERNINGLRNKNDAFLSAFASKMHGFDVKNWDLLKRSVVE